MAGTVFSRRILLLLSVAALGAAFAMYKAFWEREADIPIPFPALCTPDELHALADYSGLIPDALSFVEPLLFDPDEVVILTGGDKRPASGYAAISWSLVSALADRHGYRLLHVLDLPFDRSLRYKGVRFTPYWAKIFALPAARAAHPSARYFVWLDDDVIPPYAATHMLNHYLNMLEGKAEAMLLFAEDKAGRPLNSGIFLMKNVDWSFGLLTRLLDIGLESNARLARRVFHEQEAFTLIRQREQLDAQIPIVPKRLGRYNLNTFLSHAFFGDAFFHFAGWARSNRDWQAVQISQNARRLVELLETRFELPIQLPGSQ